MITFFDILKRRHYSLSVTQKIIYITFLTFDSQSVNEIVCLKKAA